MRAIARPTPLWEHMACSIVLQACFEIKGFSNIRAHGSPTAEFMGVSVRASGPALLAAALLAAEGAALGAIAVVETAGLLSGRAVSNPTGVALVVLTLLGAATLLLFAVGVLRRVSWARSGGIVFQVIAIAVALSSLTLEQITWWLTLAIGLPGIAGLVLLILAARRDGAADRGSSRDADT